MLVEEEIEKKPKRKRSRRDRRIERLAGENRELEIRLRKTEDRLQEVMRQLVAERREKK